MRRWLSLAGAAVAVGAIGLAVAMANLSRFVDANRPRIEEALRVALGRPIAVGEVGLSLWGGPGVRVRDVRIADDPRFGGDLLRADEVVVTIRVLPVLAGRYEVRRVSVRRPVLRIVRDDAGWNLDTLRPADRRVAGPPTPVPAGAGPPPPPRGALPVVPWRSVVRDGEVHWIDRRATLARELVVRRVRGSTSGVSPDRPVTLDVTAALAESPDSRMRLTATAGPVGDPVGRTPVAMALELAGVEAEIVKRAATMLDVVPPRRLVAVGPVSLRLRADGTPDALEGTAAFDATAAELHWGRSFAKASGDELLAELHAVRDGDSILVRSSRLRLHGAELVGAGTIRGGAPWTVDLRIEGGPTPIPAFAGLVPAAAELETAGTAAARVTVRGPVSRGRAPTVTGTVTLTDVRARRRGDGGGLTGLRAATVQVAGRLKERAAGVGGGRRRGAGRSGLAGVARIAVRDGELRGFNLVEAVLESVTGIPALSTLVSRRLRDARPGLFGGAGTRFGALDATVRFGRGRAHTRDLLCRADAYTVTGRGHVDGDGRLDLTATFLADPALTADVLASAALARWLTNDEGLLELPVRITGRMPDLRVAPTRALVTRVLARMLGGRETDGGRDEGVVDEALRRLRRLFGR